MPKSIDVIVDPRKKKRKVLGEFPKPKFSTLESNYFLIIIAICFNFVGLYNALPITTYIVLRTCLTYLCSCHGSSNEHDSNIDSICLSLHMDLNMQPNHIHLYN